MYPDNSGVRPDTPRKDVFEPEADHPASFPATKFAAAVLVQIALWSGGFVLLLPEMFQTEWANAWWLFAWIPVFVLFHSLVEYFYHRYLLHEKPITLLQSMCLSHRRHHGLTDVIAPVSAAEPDLAVPVDNRYAIEHKHQEEDMMFPLYALSIFMVLFAALPGMLLKLIVPSQPILLAAMVSIVVAYIGYEVLHAVLHLPFQKFWAPRLYQSRRKKFYQAIYGPHLVHHYRMKSNMAVWGVFLGFSFWDWLFGTNQKLARMPVPGAVISYRESQHTAGRMIAWLDRQVGWLDKARKARIKKAGAETEKAKEALRQKRLQQRN